MLAYVMNGRCNFTSPSDGTNETLYGRCNFTSSNQNTIVYIYNTLFSDFTENNGGGAIRLLNCALLCIGSNFTNCSSMSSCGGAVYLRNDDDLGMNITFESGNFFNCIALYVGACYIYISSEANDLRILFCSFVENRATAAKSSIL